MNEDRFLSADKALLIAPAGFGKTHFISNAIERLNSKQLVLTHTHAGVASIKQKLSGKNVSQSLYHVETITGFAQRFTLAYYSGRDLPDQREREYFSFVIRKATDLIARPIIAKVITNTYKGLFVDEYQDCTESQHQLISSIAKLIPTRILGDPLQAIFDFDGSTLIDLENSEQMGAFRDTIETLDENPWRWINASRHDLGTSIRAIRQKLENRQSIDLSEFPAIEHVICNEGELRDWQSDYGRSIKALFRESNLLLLHPRSDSINFRLAVTKTYLNAFHLIESIDETDFYRIARDVDAAGPDNFVTVVEGVLRRLVNKSELQNWIVNGRVVNKKVQKLEDWERVRYEALVKSRSDYDKNPSLETLRRFLAAARFLPNIKCYRREIWNSLLSSISDASIGRITVEEAMTNNRNKLRRFGRQISGRSIGTTLLTKGLEFDTVAILNAQVYKCPKNFYVAISRASKRLIIFSNSSILEPYPS